MSNPAKRLYEILDACRNDKTIQHNSMESAWRIILSVPDAYDDFIVMSKVSKIMCLPHLVAQQMKRIKGQEAEPYLGWRSDLEVAFKRIKIGNSFGGFAKLLTTSLLSNLNICSIELSPTWPDKSISEDVLREIREEVCALFDDILSAELNHELKNYLLDHLQHLIDSIDDYLITGVVGIENSIDQILGSCVTKRHIVRNVDNNDFGKRFIILLGKIGVCLKFSEVVIKSIGSLSDFIK